MWVRDLDELIRWRNGDHKRRLKERIGENKGVAIDVANCV